MLTVRSFAVVRHGFVLKHFWCYCEIFLWSKSVTVLNTAAVGPRSGGVTTSWTVWHPTCWFTISDTLARSKPVSVYVDDCYTTVCHVTWSKVKVTGVVRLWNWSISKSVSSARIHVIKRLNGGLPVWYTKTVCKCCPVRFLIFVLVRHQVTFKVRVSRGDNQQSHIFYCLLVQLRAKWCVIVWGSQTHVSLSLSLLLRSVWTGR